MHELLHGRSADEVSMNLASSLFDNFSPIGNPLGGANTWRDADAKGLLEMVPGVPFGELSRAGMRMLANRNWLGNEIAPESPFDEGKPDHLKLNRATKGSAFDKAATALSDATGGTPTQAGGIDVSPETLRFWANTLTGGVGTFTADMAHLGELGARKLAGEPGDLTPEVKEVPFLRKVVREEDIRDFRSIYWSAAREAEQAAKDLQRARKAHDDAGADKVEAERDVQLSAARMFIAQNRAIKKLRDAADEVNTDDSLSLGMKRIQIKEIEAEERGLYEDAINSYGLDVEEERKRRAGR